MAYDLIGQLLTPDEKLVRMLCLVHEAVVVVRDTCASLHRSILSIICKADSLNEFGMMNM